MDLSHTRIVVLRLKEPRPHTLDDLSDVATGVERAMGTVEEARVYCRLSDIMADVVGGHLKLEDVNGG